MNVRTDDPKFKIVVESESFGLNLICLYCKKTYKKKDYKELLEIIYASCSYTNFVPKGIGLELGSGCAAISVELVKKFPNIERVYAVEIVPEIVEFAALPLI